MKHATWYKLRGNANGRRPAYWQVPFYCDGCKKTHGKNVQRTGTLEGQLLCDRQYNKLMNNQIKAGLKVLG